DGIRRPGEPRPPRRDVAVTGPRLLRADPEGVQLAAPEVEAEAHGLPRQPRQVGPLPRHRGPRAVAAHRHAAVARQPGDAFAVLAEHLGAQLATLGRDVDEQVLAPE